MNRCIDYIRPVFANSHCSPQKRHGHGSHLFGIAGGFRARVVQFDEAGNKTTNLGILEQHLVKEGLPFTKEAVGAAHVRYVKEMQEADEAKAKAETAQAAKKAAESADTHPGTRKTALDQEAQRLLELVPHMPEIIVEMWNASMPRQGWQFVDATIKSTRKVALTALTREVYTAYTTSKGSEEALKELVKQHIPRQTATQNTQSTRNGAAQDTQSTPPGTRKTETITPIDPNSSTNQTLQANTQNVPVLRVPNVVQDASNTVALRVQDASNAAAGRVPDPVVALFERNRKLSDEEVDSFESKFSC